MEKVLHLRNVKKGYATNSSSYHTTLIFVEEEYEKWVKGEIKKDGYSPDDFFDDYESETDVTTYTTPKGEKIVVVCNYGQNY